LGDYNPHTVGLFAEVDASLTIPSPGKEYYFHK